MHYHLYIWIVNGRKTKIYFDKNNYKFARFKIYITQIQILYTEMIISISIIIGNT